MLLDRRARSYPQAGVMPEPEANRENPHTGAAVAHSRAAAPPLPPRPAFLPCPFTLAGFAVPIRFRREGIPTPPPLSW